MKRKILASLLVIAVVAGLVGASTFAYFSSSETVAVSSDAGTMDLQVSKDGGTIWYDGDTMTWSTPAAWAPGDTDCLTVDVKNEGASGAKMLRVGGQNLAGTGNLADVIHITFFDATEYDCCTYMGAPMSYWVTVFGAGELPLTLRQFVESPYSGAFWEGGHPPTTDYLDPNGSETKRFRICFEFDPNAGNEYQGTTASFDLKCTIDDDTTILGEG